MNELIDCLRRLVTANRILAREGVVDAFGHISARTPGAPDRFIMARSRSPELVTLDDLLEFGFMNCASSFAFVADTITLFIPLASTRAGP